MGPVFPHTTHNNRQIPLSGRREGTAVGGPGEGKFKDVGFLF